MGILYYNWDGAIVDLILRRIIGADFSLIDDKFYFNEHLPESWEWMEASIPVVKKGKVQWVNVRSQQEMDNGDLVKRVSVKNSPFAETIINIWTNDREITSSNNSYLSSDRADSEIVINLGKRLKNLKHMHLSDLIKENL